MGAKNKIQKVSAKGIFLKDDKVLFVQDEKGLWELPGGRIEFGETPEQALQREFEEELGMDNIKVGRIYNVWSFSSSTETADYHFIILVFEVFGDKTEIKLDNESINYGWFAKEEAMSLDMRDGYKESLEKYFEQVN